MAATFFSSPACLRLLRYTGTDNAPTCVTLWLPLKCKPAPSFSSTRLPLVCAHRRGSLPPLVSSSHRKDSSRRVSTGRRSFEEELVNGRDGESELGRRQGKDLSSRRSSTCSCSRTASSSLQLPESLVTMDDRRKILQQKGCIVWITGLSGSGKSTVAFAMDRILNSMAKVSYVLDGDKIREGLCKDLGFSAEDRCENIRRVGETAALFADAGLIAVVSFISPYKRDRDRVRELLPAGNFIEVYMDVPLEVCEKRDAKGLYKLARQGVIKAFTGIDDPYEEPVNAEIVINAVNEHGVCNSPDEMAQIIIHYLAEKGFLSA